MGRRRGEINIHIDTVTGSLGMGRERRTGATALAENEGGIIIGDLQNVNLRGTHCCSWIGAESDASTSHACASARVIDLLHSVDPSTYMYVGCCLTAIQTQMD